MRKRVFLAQQHLDHQLWNSSVYISRFLRVQQLCQIGQKSIVFLIDISNIDIFAPLIFLYLFVGKMKLLHDKCLTCSIWLPKNLSSVAGNPNGWSSYFSKKVASLNIPWPPLSRIIGDVTSMSPTLHHLFAPLTKGRAQWKSWNKSKLGILFIRKCGVKSLRKNWENGRFELLLIHQWGSCSLLWKGLLQSRDPLVCLFCIDSGKDQGIIDLGKCGGRQIRPATKILQLCHAYQQDLLNNIEYPCESGWWVLIASAQVESSKWAKQAATIARVSAAVT